MEGYRGSTDCSRGEVRGDGGARADPRVEECGNARLEALSRTADKMEGQVDGTGRVLTAGRIQFGSTIWSSVGEAEVGLSLIGLTKDTLGLRWAGGPIPQTLSEGVTLKGVGVGRVGSSGSKGKKVSKVEIGPRFGPTVSQRKSSGPFLTNLKDFGVQPFGPSVMNSHGPTEFQLTKGPLGKSLAQPGFCGEVNIDRQSPSKRSFEVWVSFKLRGLKGFEDSFSFYLVFIWSDSRGGVFLSFWGVKGGLPDGILINCQDAAGLSANGNDCWELVEFNGPISVARDSEGGSSQYESQEGRGERALNWEDSSLAKFSQFLGFSAEGLEKEILSFLVKI